MFKNNSLSLIAVVILFLLAFIILNIKIEFPQIIQLKTSSLTREKLKLEIPNGDHFFFLVGISSVSNSTNVEFEGSMAITKHGHERVELFVDKRSSKKTNWLKRENLDGYLFAVDGNAVLASLDSFLASGDSVDIEFDFGSNFNTDMSIWLYYIEQRPIWRGLLYFKN